VQPIYPNFPRRKRLAPETFSNRRIKNLRLPRRSLGESGAGPFDKGDNPHFFATIGCPDQKPDPLVFQLQKIKMTFMNAYHFGNYLVTLFHVPAFQQVGL